MKRAIVLLGILLLSAPSLAHGQTTVLCQGMAAGGGGVCDADMNARDFLYLVNCAVIPPRCTLYVGTEDPVSSHYTGWCMPPGWTWSIIPTASLDPGYGTLMDDYNSFTPHGIVSPGPTGFCPYVIRMEGIPPGSFWDLGFNHPGYPHDVSWLFTSAPTTGTRSNWASQVGNGAGPVHGPGAVSDCHIDQDTEVLTHVAVGRRDNFATGDGVEPATPGDALLTFINANCPLGPLTCHPGQAVCECDCSTIDRCFGHTFTGQWNMAGNIFYSAHLYFKIKAGSGADNDNISFREEGVGVWGMLIKDLRNACVGDHTWDPGDVFEYGLDLANLPIDGRGITDVRGLLMDGDLDFFFSDDTQIDYVELNVYTCCNECIATGDINSDGIPLATSDLIYLMNFVNNAGPAPQPPCIADLNDDGYVDQYDLDIFQDYFIYGMSVFPQYPVITKCVPDTVRGCCCKANERVARSSTHCALEGGVYSGDGVLCGDVPLPPVVVSTVPAANAVGVNKTAPISVTFNTRVVSFDGVHITGSQSGSHLLGTSEDPSTMTWTITFVYPDFIAGEVVTILLTGPDTRTIEEVPMCTDYSWSFTIGSKKGSGTFGPPVTYYLGASRHPADLAPADMDHDNDPDIVLVVSDSTGNVDSVAIVNNNGSGGATVSGVYPTGFKGSSSGKPAHLCGVADFNSDGRNDVAVVKDLDDGDYISIMMGVGTKGENAVLSPMGVHPVGFKGASSGKEASIIADVDGDNDLDIVVADNTDAGSVKIALMINSGGGSSWVSHIYTVGFVGVPVGPPSLSGGDMDGDGDGDFVIVQTLDSGVSAAVMQSDGSGGCSLDGIYPVGFKGSTSGKPASIIGDVDGDGDLDVIVVDAIAGADSLALLTNNGSGGCTLDGVHPVGFKGASSGKPASILADVDGDGDLDVVFSEAFLNGDSMAVNLNNGSGGYTCDGVYPAGFKGTSTGMPQKIVAADLDEGSALKQPMVNGGIDLLHVNFEACSLAVIFSRLVACTCPCRYDPQCDGVISDVLDVVNVINVAFRGQPAVQDSGCPRERTDVDATGASDVIDVTKVINVAFRGQSVAANYVDPCL